MEENSRESISRSRTNINIRSLYIKYCINSEEVKVEHCSTNNMLVHYFTKPFQGSKFVPFGLVSWISVKWYPVQNYCDWNPGNW